MRHFRFVNKSRGYYTLLPGLARIKSPRQRIHRVVVAPQPGWTAQRNEGERLRESSWAQSWRFELFEGSEAPRIGRGAAYSVPDACLPAVTAVAAISTTITAASATAASSTAATATASTAVPTTTASATTAAALRLGTRFIHNEVSPAKILTIQGIDRAVRIFIVSNFDEGKTA